VGVGMEQFISATVSTFLGAFIAFLFALFLYSLKKKAEHGTYLSYAISMLSAQATGLYSFKKDISEPRKPEIEDLEKQFSNINKQDVILRIREISQYISNGKNFTLPIDLEKLSFLADFDPNILVLFKVCLNASGDVDQLIDTCNLEISKCRDEKGRSHDVYMLLQINKQLLEQIDYTLVLVEKLQELLISFSKLEYKEYVIISEIQLEKEYISLKPQRESSWHKLEYLSRKRDCLQKVKRGFKRIFNC
jgi:hypothetical protein